jgi:hypothetical protein
MTAAGEAPVANPDFPACWYTRPLDRDRPTVRAPRSTSVGKWHPPVEATGEPIRAFEEAAASLPDDQAARGELSAWLGGRTAVLRSPLTGRLDAIGDGATWLADIRPARWQREAALLVHGRRARTTYDAWSEAMTTEELAGWLT